MLLANVALKTKSNSVCNIVIHNKPEEAPEIECYGKIQGEIHPTSHCLNSNAFLNVI